MDLRNNIVMLHSLYIPSTSSPDDLFKWFGFYHAHHFKYDNTLVIIVMGINQLFPSSSIIFPFTGHKTVFINATLILCLLVSSYYLYFKDKK